MSTDAKTLEDVRNLIVCDSQFGWTGSTTLRLQQMLDLRKRGWLAEGAENNEFDLTDVGREIVARALHGAVQPTLADVQPGGRVRLGDRPKDGEVLVEVSGLTGSGKSAIAGEIEILCKALGLDAEWVNGDEEKRLTHADWIGALEMYKPRVVIVEQNISRAALSAQPSPGGLDALASLPLYRLADDANGNRGLHRDDTGSWVKLQDVERALAARQPVGEPVAWYYGFSDTGEAGPVTFGGNPGAEAIAWAERHGHTLHYLYAAPPAQAVEMSPEFTDTARAAIAWVLWHHQGGSSPVGQPLRFALGMGQHDRLTDHQVSEAKRFAAFAGATTGGFHHHKAAQAVDLGQFRPMVEEFRRNWANYGRTMTAAGKDTSTARQNVDAADRLLALIDSQAVGNG